MRKLPIALCLLILAVPSDASEWFAAECSTFHRHGLDQDFTDAASYEKALAEAGPGSALYIPRPFPETPEAVMEDLRWWHHKTWSATEKENLPPEERLFAEALATGSFKVHRVANWTPYRCNEVRRRDFYYLVSLRDATGSEVARVSLNRFGFVTGSSSLRPGLAPELAARFEAAFPSLGDARARISTEHGVEGGDPQYVWSLGPRARCRKEAPCVALRASDEVFLYQPRNGGHLFRFTAKSRRLSLSDREELASNRASEGKPTQAPDVADFVSLGDQWVEIEELPPSPASSHEGPTR